MLLLLLRFDVMDFDTVSLLCVVLIQSATPFRLPFRLTVCVCAARAHIYFASARDIDTASMTHINNIRGMCGSCWGIIINSSLNFCVDVDAPVLEIVWIVCRRQAVRAVDGEANVRLMAHRLFAQFRGKFAKRIAMTPRPTNRGEHTTQRKDGEKLK